MIVFGALIVLSIPKNTYPLAHLINNSSLEVTVVNTLDEDEVIIECIHYDHVAINDIVHESGTTYRIPKGYGEFDWVFHYQNVSAKIRHFSTNNWHDHDYFVKFYETSGGIYCDFKVEGPDPMPLKTLQLRE